MSEGQRNALIVALNTVVLILLDGLTGWNRKFIAL